MRTFLLIWAGQLTSLLGSYLTAFALGVWVFQKHGSTTDYALVSVCILLPMSLLSPIAGPVVDRYDRRVVMLVSDAVAALGTFLLLFLVWRGSLEIGYIYLTTALTSCAAAFQQPAYTAVIAQLVPKEKLGRANGMVQTASGLGQLISPLAAAFLLGVIALRGIILIDLATFLFAVWTLLRVRLAPRAPEPGDGKGNGMWARLAEGFAYLKRRNGLVAMLVFFAISNFSVAMMIVLATPLILSFSTIEVLGVLSFTSGLGFVAGGLLMSVWGGPRRLMLGILAAQAVCGFSAMGAGMTTNPVWLGLASFCFFAASSVVSACYITLWQRKVPLGLQGRVQSIRVMVIGSTMLVAYLVAGPLADQVFEPRLATGGAWAAGLGEVVGTGTGRGIGAILFILGCASLVLTSLAASLPLLRRLDIDMPDALDGETVTEL